VEVERKVVEKLEFLAVVLMVRTEGKTPFISLLLSYRLK
jgi:hypothetical protein